MKPSMVRNIFGARKLSKGNDLKRYIFLRVIDIPNARKWHSDVNNILIRNCEKDLSNSFLIVSVK